MSKDFWHLLKPYWMSEEKWIAWALLFLNILCVVCEVRTSIGLNSFNKDFFDALQNFDKSALINSLWHYAILLILLVLSFGYGVYFSGLLSVRWRRWLTEKYIKAWLTNRAYYHLQFFNQIIDNPDQRISEDLEQFAELTLKLFFAMTHSALTLFSFGYVLWSLSENFGVPGGLFWAAILYAVIGSVVMGWIGKNLSRLDYKRQKRNANFRFELVRVRESSEQIALYQGESEKNKILNSSFRKIFSNAIQIVNLKKQLALFSNGYNTASFAFGLLISTPVYFAKKIQLGGVMQISGAFGAVVGAFSVFVNMFTSIANWRAVIYRLVEFNRSLEVILQKETKKLCEIDPA